MKKALTYILTRTPFLYLLLFIILNTFVDNNKIKEGMKVRVLNNLIPTSYAVFFSPGNANRHKGKNDLKPLIEYYEKITKYLPKNADAYGFLGYCYYLDENYIKAEKSFQSAINKNPHIFWFHYNLGLTLFKQNKHDKAIKSLSRSIGTDPKLSFIFMKESKLYRHLALNTKDINLKDRLFKGYAQSYAAMILIHQKTKNYPAIFKIAQHALTHTRYKHDFFYFYAGLAHYEMSSHKQAAFYFQESIKLNAKSFEAFEFLDLSMRALGYEDIANKAFAQATLLKKKGVHKSYKNQHFYPQLF